MDNKKYFVVSDIHGFATELKKSLRQAGYQKRNKNHILIILGDIFDRGSEALEVYNFILSVPKSRRVLIRGNHESLFLDLLNKKYPESHDFSNGTVDTFCQIAGVDMISDEISAIEYLESGVGYYDNFFQVDDELDYECRKFWQDIKRSVKNSKITSFLKSNEWKNYYELDKYIFVHSFIPVIIQDKLPMYYTRERHFEYDKNWRDADQSHWNNAIWGCPWEQYSAGLFDEEEKNNKVLVCGHWHTSDFYKYLKNITTYNNKLAPIYFSKHLIGIDGGCGYNHKTSKYDHPQNILVIDENMVCYDKFNNKLEEAIKED